MSVIARPRWTRQPQGAIEIDWSHPLTRRLVSCLELRGNRVQDLASSLVINHTRPIDNTLKGRAASFNGTALINTGVTSLGGQSLFATSGNPFTVSLLVRRTASNTYFAKASATSANRTFQIGEGGGVGDATPFVGIRGTFTNTNLGFSDSNWHLYTVVFDGTSATIFVDSTKSAALTVGTAAEETTENVTIGGRTASSPGSLFSGNVAFVRVWSRALAQREHLQLWSNPWQIFVPQREVIYSIVGGTNVTATIAPTQAADTAAVDATVTNRVSLAPTQAADTAAVDATVTNRVSLAPTQAADTAAVDATVTNRVSLAPTQAADTAAIGVSVGNDVTATIAPTQAADTAAVNATVTNRVSLAPTQAADTAAIGVAVASAVSVTIAPTQAADTAAVNATVTNRVSLAPTQAVDVAAVGVTVANRVSIAATQAADTAAISATVTNRVSLDPTQAADTAAVGATVTNQIIVAPTQAADIAAVVARVTNRIALAPTQAADVAAINSFVGSITAALAPTQAPDTAAISVVFLWAPIDTSQTPGWSNISTTQNANWSSITTTQTANWQPVNTGS